MNLNPTEFPQDEKPFSIDGDVGILECAPTLSTLEIHTNCLFDFCLSDSHMVILILWYTCLSETPALLH